MKKSRIIIVFISGFLGGCFVTCCAAYYGLTAIQKHATWNAKRDTAHLLLDRATAANRVRSGNLSDYYAYIDTVFKTEVPQVYSFSMDSDFGKPAIWAVQEYYDNNHVPVPDEIKPILDSVPRRK
jgi:hypothetical protein